MKHIRKRILSLLLAVLFCCLSGLGGLAGASGASKASNAKADALKSLGLFQGTEKGYELEGKTTRIQGLVMLIRLLGQEEEALAHDEASPFEDLKWGKCYAAYAYEKGITNGTSKTTFTPNGELYGRDYITFLLRALGYSDDEEAAERDFTYATQLQFAAEIGMITPEAAVTLKKLKINRGDMVDISYAALTTKVKGSNRTLAEKLCAEGVFTREQAVSAGVIGSGGRIYDYIPYDDSTVSLRRESIQTSEGAVKVNIITVNTQSPKVSVKAAMVDSALRHTAPFSEIVTSSGAFAAINGNFFNSYDDKMPIGHVMADGEFLYCCSGITSIGISTTGELCIGRPSVFTRIKASDGSEWSAYEVNTEGQGDWTSVMYTPAYGSSFTMKVDGKVFLAEGGKLKSFTSYEAGAEVSIPQNGFAVFMGKEYYSTDYFRTPVIGTELTTQPYLRITDEEGFTLQNIESIVSGAPRLVKDGKIVTELEEGWTEARFTTACTPRTAAGITGEGRLLLVNAAAATIQQLREVMLSLGCVDAINLDGGGSTGMYYNGEYLSTPGRELTTTLQIFLQK